MKEHKESKLKLIPIELADMMIKAYQEQRRVTTSKELSKKLGEEVEDTRFAWISKEALIELLEINKADGLRLYFGIADDYPNHKLKRPEYRKKTTLVLVATRSTDPDNPTMENSIDCLNIAQETDTDKPNGKKIGPVIAPIAQTRAGLPADDIPICPPPPQNPGGALLPL